MLTYNTFFQSFFNTVAAVSTATPIGPDITIVSSYTDPYWAMELPNVIDAGEQRIFRDLDLLNWRVADNTATLTAGQRSFQLPTVLGTFRKIEGLSVIGVSSDVSVTPMRFELIPHSRAWLDAVWPSESTWNGLPRIYAMLNNQQIILGPTPDQNYPMEVIGPQTPQPLSLANPVTFISTMLPDLFFAACMIKASAYMRDFGAMMENPQMSVNWEANYQALLRSADIEEAGRWYRSAGWTAQAPKPVTTPPRV